MKKKRLQSIAEKTSFVIMRATDEEKAVLHKARIDLKKSITTMMKEALFDFYLPQAYKEMRSGR